MRILFLSPRRCWPVNSGARLRDYYLARQLSERARVTYVAICPPEAQEISGDGLPRPETIFERNYVLEDVRPFALATLLRGWWGSTPATVLKWTSPVAAQHLAAIGQSMAFDSIHVVGVHLAKYLPVLRELPGRPPVICDWHDILSEQMARYAGIEGNLPRRIYARRTATLLWRAETEMLAACDSHTTVSALDRSKMLERASGKVRIEIIANGVDTAYFRQQPGNTDRRRLLFVGAMNYHANVDAAVHFAREEWPAVRQRIRDLRLTIVGRKPDAAVQALASEEMGIEVTGTVDDVRPYYREARAAVVPLRAGSGTRLKILEAMAAGVPVVSTSIGAEGLEVKNGDELMIADQPAVTVDAIARVCEPGVFRERLIARGRALVERRYDWEILGEQLFRVHNQMAGPTQ
jgi:glycosyltransferase involved in cell wall biosynthesis